LEGKGCVDEDPDASETTLCRVSPSYPLTGKSDVSIDSFETVLAFISNDVLPFKASKFQETRMAGGNHDVKTMDTLYGG